MARDMAIRLTHAEMRGLLPPRPADAHKGTFGHLLIAAGSRGLTGAAKLAAFGALRSGVGLVTLAVPRPLADPMAIALMEAMSLPMPATPEETFATSAADDVLDLSDSMNALALGPGISRHIEAAEFARRVYAEWPHALVADADALNALAAEPDALAEPVGPRVLTPHPGEMARLLGASTQEVQLNRETVAAEFARRYGCVVLLKGRHTVITDGARVAINPTGNSGMATGGSGDVLTGLTGGLLAQGLAPMDAACVAAYVHGLAGDLAAEAYTQRATIARDIIEALPAAWMDVENEPLDKER